MNGTSAPERKAFQLLTRDAAAFQHYWTEAERTHVPREQRATTARKPSPLEKLSSRERRFHLYLPRNIEPVFEMGLQEPEAFVQISSRGQCVGMLGNPDIIRSLTVSGLGEGAYWTLDAIGPNAASVGMKEFCSCVSRGEDQYASALQKYAVYFVPLSSREANPPFEEQRLGGLAMLVPLAEDRSDLCLILTMMANALMLNQHHIQRHYRQHQMTGREILTIDTSVHPGEYTITSVDRPLFQMLNLEPMELYLRPLRLLIDPLPANREFWDIVQNKLLVNDRELTIAFQGKTRTCVISTDVFEQPRLHLTGMLVFFTTPQRISKQISEKSGNSAVRTFDNLIGQSAAIKSAVRRARLIANTDSNMLLLGESGVGKDVFAQAIHNASARRGKPFIAVNCGALPRDLIASELFGYEAGAFTGAKRQGNIGKFELANGGTLFLDEIGELPLDLQATLLRAVEQKRFTRLGGNKEIDVDVKIISATNANLLQMAEERRFREDLYYRLSTVQVVIPPLRERGEDILLLAEYFIDRVAKRMGRYEKITLSDDAKAVLMAHRWRGNVRELQNLMEGIVQIYPDNVITREHILENLRTPAPVLEPVAPVQIQVQPQSVPAPPKPQGKKTPPDKEQLLAALEQCGGNRSAAAAQLGISRRTIYRYLEQFGIE